MGVWYQLGARFRQPRTEDGNAPGIAPPLPIMAFIPVSALWLTFTLLFSVSLGMSPGRQIALALVGGFAPIAIAYGVMTNRRWTRIGILAAVAANVWFYGVTPGASFAGQVLSRPWLAASVFMLAGLALYLYGGAAPRAYYLLIAGRPLPDDLKDVDFAPPQWLQAAMKNLSIVAEWALILLALGIFFGLAFFYPQVARWLSG